ncbi:glycine zipper family protein [Rahnella sp. SL6]|uniref:glycine zipper family protein n=1 Tax=Rahnella perminowiae TaxID=2816244 RepID=UPI001C26D46E|nr:glycine zipper family protein [Rahnella perminowiae]MBU9811003.1 glycine zipper family protein [Rahnella perminowiae]
MNRFTPLAVITLAAALSGCVSSPTRPGVMVLPGTGKDYQQFRMDEMACRSDAYSSVNGGAQTANNNAVNTAAAGTVVGAAAGALLGAASHQAGAGALVGAGSGLLLGSAMGSNGAGVSSGNLQDQYNTVYTQCMYAKGNKVPVDARYDYGLQSHTQPEVPPDYYPAQTGNNDVPPDYVP